MAIDISSTSRRIVYTGSAGTGPYAFNFEVLAQTDIAVYKNDTELTLTTDYTVTVDSDGTGSVTLVTAAVAADRITIVGDRTIQRTTDFTTGGPLFAATLNDEFDSQTIFVQQVQEQSDRSLRAPNTDPTNIDMVLPINTIRANKTLAFDNDGNPVIGEQIGDYRGDWAASTSYNKRDLVKDTTTDNIYMANTAHTSSGAEPLTTNTDSAKWDLIVDAEAANTAKVAAQTAQTAAEAAQAAAETAETNAETAETNAETAETNAETAQTAAEAAKTAAETAQAAAETAETNAATSETNAATSATSASTSATTATTQANAASTSATNAATSATSAATSATTATTQATTATTQATTATTKANEASTSATNAATSATSAETAKTAAEAAQAAAETALDNFDDIYLGAKASDPTLDNDGDALSVGDIYFNTTSNETRVYNGTAWQATAISADGFLTASNNLSDVSNASTSRTNLGLGSLAVKNTVATADIDADAVDGTKIADDAIGNEHIATDAVNADSIAADAVGASELNVTGNGTAGQALLSDGDGTMTWGSAGGDAPLNNAQVFVANGTWTAPSGVNRARVLVVGGGAGGSKAGPGKNGDSPGGNGGIAHAIVSVTPGTTYNITVGAGGIGVARNNNTNANANGGNGGVSRFHNWITANGGNGAASYNLAQNYGNGSRTGNVSTNTGTVIRAVNVNNNLDTNGFGMGGRSRSTSPDGQNNNRPAVGFSVNGIYGAGLGGGAHRNHEGEDPNASGGGGIEGCVVVYF